MHINSSKYQKIYIYIYIKVFHTIHQYYNYQDKKKEQNSRKHLPLVFTFFFGYLFDISSKNHCTTREKKS